MKMVILKIDVICVSLVFSLEFTALEDIPLMEEDETYNCQEMLVRLFSILLDKTQLQMFANSWIYNTSTRFEG